MSLKTNVRIILRALAAIIPLWRNGFAGVVGIRL